MFRSASANAPGTYRYVKQTVTGLAATTSPQLKQRARFQTSAMIRHLLFCDIMQQFLDCLTLEDGTTACPETLVNNHQYTLCNIPQQWGLEANYMDYYTVNQMSLWFVPPTCFSLHVAILLEVSNEGIQ